MKVQFIEPQRNSWELDILPNILIIGLKKEIRFAISFLLWGIVFIFKR